jgi:microcin C transport system permease protein
MFVALIIVSLLRPNFWLLLGICLMFNWVQVAAVTRTEFLRIREQDFVRAAEIMGLSRTRIMLKHILPNAIFGILVYFPYLFTNAIIQLTALTFLGFGLPPETASLGDLLNQAKDNLSAPWIGVSAIVTLVIVLTLLMTISEKLRDIYKKSSC